MQKYLTMDGLEYFAKRMKQYIDVRAELTHNHQTNCPNCSAPITGTKCEYCGTNFDPTIIFRGNNI